MPPTAQAIKNAQTKNAPENKQPFPNFIFHNCCETKLVNPPAPLSEFSNRPSFIFKLDHPTPALCQRRALLWSPLVDKQLRTAEESRSFCRCSHSCPTAQTRTEWRFSWSLVSARVNIVQNTQRELKGTIPYLIFF